MVLDDGFTFSANDPSLPVVTNATSEIVVSAYRKVSAGTVAKEKAFLAERPTAQQYAGAALMLAGVVASQVLQPAKAELAAEVTSRER